MADLCVRMKGGQRCTAAANSRAVTAFKIQFSVTITHQDAALQDEGSHLVTCYTLCYDMLHPGL
jgi:hypothetical protein